MAEPILFGRAVQVAFYPDSFGVTLRTTFAVYETPTDFEPWFLNAEGRKIPFCSAQKRRVQPYSGGTGQGVRVQLSDFEAEGKTYALALELCIRVLEAEGDVIFELTPLKEVFGEVKELCWPGPLLVTGQQQPGFTALPISQGMLVPDACKDDFETFTGGQLFSREAVQPWWGSYRKSGCLSIVQTPFDAAVQYRHKPGSATQVHVRWWPSLGLLSYNRVLRIKLLENCDYVVLAKTYRAWLLATQGLCTLKEKCLKTPQLKKMIGTPVVLTPFALHHCVPESPVYDPAHPEENYKVCTFEEMGDALEALQRRGLGRYYCHIDGWGRQGYDNEHPDILPPCEPAGGTKGLLRLLQRIQAMGGLSALHDQYRDYYTRAETYDEDNAVRLPDGTLPHWSAWLGGEQKVLCAQLAPDYVRRNYAWLNREGICPDGVYLDVFSVVEPDECSNPRHRMTRKECVDKRIECFEFMRSDGKIVSSEEGISVFADHIDLVHHAPYIYEVFTICGLEKPGLIPVPLLELVYHDCFLVPWYLKKGGWGLPKEDCGALHGLLNGGIPMLDFQPADGELEMCHVMGQLHRAVWDQPMVSHAFLSGDGRCQQSKFANGTVVTVDWRSNSYKIDFADGRSLQGVAHTQS